MSWEHFFNYGDDVEGTIQSDVSIGLRQAKGIVFFNRGFGADVPRLENRSGLQRELELKFDIAEFFANRNNEVPEELQVITSINSIEIVRAGSNGDRDVNVTYYGRNFKKGTVSV